MPRKKLSARSVTEEVEVKGDEGELKLSNPTNESSEVPPTPITDGDEGCIICLETIKVRGEIDSCPHQFCFDCILKWSKVTNTCPVCKRNFLKVTEVQISQNTSAASSSGNGGKGKKKKKPKVVKIKPKPQRVEAPPMMPDFYAYDIRALFLHLTSMMWADDEDDSDYVDDDEDEEFQWAFTRYTPPSVEIPTVNLNDIYENGRHVIEILDDEDPEHDAGLFFNDEDDDEVQIISAPVGNSSRRGRRGESLFAPVGSSSYRAARQRITTSGSGRAAPPQLNSQRHNPQSSLTSSSRSAPASSKRTQRVSLRQTSSLPSQRGELNSLPTTLPHAVSVAELVYGNTSSSQRGELNSFPTTLPHAVSADELVHGNTSSKRKRQNSSSSVPKASPTSTKSDVVFDDEEIDGPTPAVSLAELIYGNTSSKRKRQNSSSSVPKASPTSTKSAVVFDDEEIDGPTPALKMQRMSTLEDTEEEEAEEPSQKRWLRRRRAGS